jgi:hypothetical protein
LNSWRVPSSPVRIARPNIPLLIQFVSSPLVIDFVRISKRRSRRVRNWVNRVINRSTSEELGIAAAVIVAVTVTVVVVAGEENIVSWLYPIMASLSAGIVAVII